MHRGSIFQNRFSLLSGALSSFNVIMTTTFLILMAIFLNFTNKLFIIGKKSCLRHLTARPTLLSQTIWNNKFITIAKKMVYLPHWHRAGIKQISDLSDEHENCFLPFLSLRNKYTLNCNFLQYHSLLSAIPQSWKKLLHVNSGDSTTSPPPICTITCKMLYDKLFTLENLPLPTSEKNSYLTASQKRI